MCFDELYVVSSGKDEVNFERTAQDLHVISLLWEKGGRDC